MPVNNPRFQRSSAGREPHFSDQASVGANNRLWVPQASLETSDRALMRIAMSRDFVRETPLNMDPVVAAPPAPQDTSRFPGLGYSPIQNVTKGVSSAFSGWGPAAIAGGVSSIFDLAGTIYKANKTYDLGLKQVGVQNRQVDFENSQLGFNRQMWQKDWDAASSAGLASPSQLGNTQNSGYYRSSGATALLTRGTYSTREGPYS